MSATALALHEPEGVISSGPKGSNLLTQAERPSVPTQAPKQDRRGIWRDYQPDSRVAIRAVCWWVMGVDVFLSCVSRASACCQTHEPEQRNHISGDDYDPRSAPLLPPPEDEHKDIRRQAVCAPKKQRLI